VPFGPSLAQAKSLPHLYPPGAYLNAYAGPRRPELPAAAAIPGVEVAAIRPPVEAAPAGFSPIVWPWKRR